MLPAAGWAQSAGDNQYTDPFGAEQPSGSGGGGSSGGGSQGSGSAEPRLGQEQATPTAQTETASDQPSSGSVGGVQLPRTGVDSGVVALIGVLMLVGGLTIRLAVVPAVGRLRRDAPTVIGRDVLLPPPSRRGR
jgi:hypothetical protein